MMHRLRQHCLAHRALWVALLAIALVGQPTLLLASEVHESEHLVQSGHSHGAERLDQVLLAEELADAEGSEAWHLLMHLSHCCGQPSAMPAESLAMPTIMRPFVAPIRSPLAIQSLIPTLLLRPPIHS